MIGYPVGLMDEVNLQPIFRRGVYATNPSLDYMGRKEFLLDIPNNGGSSGSPVFHFDEKMYDVSCQTQCDYPSRIEFDKKPPLPLQLPGDGFVLVFVL